MIRWFALTNVCTLCWPTIVKFIFDWLFFKSGREKGGKGGRELFLSLKISMWYRFIVCFCIFSPIRWFIPKRDGCCVICLMVSWEGNRKSYSVLQYLTRHSPSGDIRFSVILYQYPWYFCLFKKILVIFVDKLVRGKNKKRQTTALYMLLIVWQLFFFFITIKQKVVTALCANSEWLENSVPSPRLSIIILIMIFIQMFILLQDSWVKEWNGTAWILGVSLLWWCTVRSETYTCKYWLQLITTENYWVSKWFKL